MSPDEFPGRPPVTPRAAPPGTAPSWRSRNPSQSIYTSGRWGSTAAVEEPTDRPYILFPVGYPAREGTVPDLRSKPLEEVLVDVTSPQ